MAEIGKIREALVVEGVDIVLVEYEPGQFSLVIRSKRWLSEAFLDELKHMFARHGVIADITVNPAESK